MNRSLRVAIDCRRGPGSGVGRVTQSIVKAVVELSRSQPISPVLLTSTGTQFGFDDLAEIHRIDIPVHSQKDRLEYPNLLKQLSVDVFFAPQYYVVPYSSSITIRHVHDLWPLLHPKWIPTPADFEARFGSTCLKESLLFTTDFLRNQPKNFSENHYFPSFIKRNEENPIAIYYCINFFLALELSNRIIAPSLHTFEEIRTIFPSALPRVSVIPNAVDPEFVLAKLHASPQSKPHNIFHVANWEPRKNIECLLEAFEQFRSFGFTANLSLVGNNGSIDYANKIHRLIARHPYRDSINVLGFIPDNALSDYFISASVFVCSSYYEGFCIPVQEAMASGVPVIASQETALKEICGSAALFFNPNEAGSLSNQLINVLTNAQLRQDLADRGVSNSRKFGIEPFTQSLMLLLQSLEEFQ